MSSFQVSESTAMQCSGVETPVVGVSVLSTEGVLSGGKYRMVLTRVESEEDSPDCSSVEEVDDGVDAENLQFSASEVADFAASLVLDEVKPKKQLSIVSKAFVPQYHSNMTIEQVREIATMDGVSDEDLESKGYPKFLVTKIRKCEVREAPINPFKLSARDRHSEVNLYSDEKPSLSAKAAKVRSHFDLGEVAKVWVIPNRQGALPTTKPTRYSKRTFHAWCLGKAAYLYRSIAKLTQVVTGNSACRALFFESGAMNQRVADQLLQKAEVYVEDFNSEGKQGGFGLTLGHFTDQKLMSNYNYFMIGDVKVDSVDKAVAFEPLFKRHGPIYRRLLSALSGDVTVDVATLQSAINEKIMPPSVNKVLVSTRFQGNLCPRRLAVAHTFSDADGVDRPMTVDTNVRLSFDVSSITSIFASPIPMGESMVRMSARIVSFIVSLLTSKDWKNVSAVVTLFVSSDPKIFNYVGNKISNALAGVSMFQGTFENVFLAIKDSLGSFWEVVVSSTILAMLKEVKESMFSIVGPLIFDLVKETKRAIGKESATSIAKHLFAWIGDILGRLKECVRTKSMSPLWGEKWDASVWLRYAQSYERYYVALTTSGTSPTILKELAGYRDLGFIPSFWVTPKSIDDYLLCCDEHIEQGSRIKDYYQGHPEVAKTISVAQARLVQFTDTIRMSNGSRGERVAPMGFFFYGPPGVGKTNLIQQVIQALGHLNSIPCDGKSTHLWQVGVNFQDGLNHTHSWIVMDDVDAGVAAPAAGVPTHVENVINLVNNKPCPIEQADLSMKGKVFACPSGLFYATNFQDGRAVENSLEPHAFYRRFGFYVEVRVKPEFAKEGGLLDATKASDSTTHDMYELHVSEYKPSTQPDQFKTDPVVMSFSQFLKKAQAAFAAHLLRETKNIQRRTTMKAWCPTCGLPSDKTCGCVTCTELQGAIWSRAEAEQPVPPQPEPTPPESRVSTELEPMCWAYQVLAVFHLTKRFEVRIRNLREYQQMLNLAIYIHENEGFPALLDLLEMHNRDFNLQEYLYVLPDLFVGFPTFDEVQGVVPVQSKATKLKYRIGNAKYALEEHFGIQPIGWVEVTAAFVVGCVGIYALNKLFALVEHITSKVSNEFQGREGNVSANAPIPTDWQRADQKFKPGVPASFGTATYTLEDLEKSIEECYVSVASFKDGKRLDMHAFVMAPGWIAVPTHLTKFGSDITVTQNGVNLSFVVGMASVKVFPSNPEMSLLRVPGLKLCCSLVKKMWYTEDASIQQFDAMRIYANGLKHTPQKSYIRKWDNGSTVISTNAVTADGECGSLYVGCHNGAWKIVGMHIALDSLTTFFGETSQSVAALLSVRELEVLFRQVGTQFQGGTTVLSTFTKIPEDLQTGRFGKYSEIWAAHSQSGVSFHPFGEMKPPLPNSTMKSKVTLSILYPEVKPVIDRLCERPDYWKIPQFRGEMSNGVWDSAWTNMFVTQNKQVPDAFFMKLAVYDYVNGIDLLDRTGYAVLSEEQMLTGIPGSYINAINMKTSAGPPLKGGKRSHFFLDSIDGSYASPEIWNMFDRLEEILAEGDIPVVLCVCALKDEPLKYSKKHPRVFNVLPAAMNLVMKKHGAAWKSFMRANFQFFESAVGINMTSSECNKVLDFMRLVSPDLTRLFDADAKAMDKSWSDVCFEYVAIAIFVISASIGVSPFENFNLAKSMNYIVYSIKNDLFNVAQNPSGGDWTVELNGLLVSIGERYVYYRSHGFDGDRKKVEDWFANVFSEPMHEFDASLTFRKNVALATYGDDNVKAMSEDPAPNYEEIWEKEIGIVMTDASKEGKMRQKNVSEISFLKRDFVKLDGIQGYVAKLSKYSMARMLMMKKDSTLGDADHSAVVLSEFFREALYHGRGFYDEMLSALVPAAEKLGLTTNPYYVVKSFDERLEEAKLGNYQTWSLREPVERLEITETLFQGKMSNVSFANGSKFDPSATDAGTTLTHSVGTISTSASMVQDHMVGSAKYLQNVPSTDLNAVLTRATLIADVAISNADVPGSDVLSFDPWALYLANPLVAAKLQNFSYMRSTLQVVLVTTVPGMAYGLYTVTGMPDGGVLTAGETAVAAGLTTVNVLQGDHCAMINCSESNSVVLQLPFLGSSDYWALPGAGSDTPIQAWAVYLRTLRALATSVSGGVTTGRVQVYANMLDDYALAVPRFQGKQKLVANDALKRLAPNLHSKISEGKGSKMMGAIADVAESASALPVIGAFASTAGAVARGAESVLSWFGFTVYQNEETPKYFISRSIGNVAHTEGDDAGFSASLSLQSEISIDPSLNGPYGPSDCLSFAELFPRWTLVKTMSWPTTAASQDDLGAVYVSPFYCTSNGTSVYLTTAGYAGLPFTYWRGDMEYMIVIPVATTHRGKLQVFWTPQGSTAADDVTNVSYNAIFDVAAGPMKTISVGYAREKPFLNCTLVSDALSIIPVGDCNGTLQFRVINPLTSSSATAGTSIFVFARAKSNMEFAVPRDTIMFRNAAGSSMLEYVIQANTKLQGAIGDDDSTATSEEVMELVPSSGEFPSDLVFFGEKVKSCRELLQKPSKMCAANISPTLHYQIPCPFPTPQSSVANSFVNVWTWQGHYRALFYGLTFSERWKVLLSGSDGGYVGASRGTYTTTPFLATMNPVTYTGPGFGSEFRLPYYGNQKFLRSYVSAPATAAKQVSRLFYTPNSNDAGELGSIWYYSWGADIRATCFRQVPVVTFTEAAVSGFSVFF